MVTRRAPVIPQLFVAAVLLGVVALLVRGYHDPHKLFGFQPFDESDVWRVDLYREIDGDRVLVEGGGWEGYRWNVLVPPQLRGLGHLRHASGGAANTIDFLDDALDWVADNTPADTTTDRLVAEVTWYHNTRGPNTTRLTSDEREEAGEPS